MASRATRNAFSQAWKAYDSFALIYYCPGIAVCGLIGMTHQIVDEYHYARYSSPANQAIHVTKHAAVGLGSGVMFGIAWPFLTPLVAVGVGTYTFRRVSDKLKKSKK